MTVFSSDCVLPELVPLYTRTILCLIPRTTVMSLSAPKDTRCETHPFMRQSRCSFLNAWENTQVAPGRDDKRLPPEYALMSLTVVLEVRQSIDCVVKGKTSISLNLFPIVES